MGLREDHSRSERSVVIAGIVDIEADEVAEAMDEVLAKSFAVQVFAVRVDVVVGDVVKRVGLITAQVGFSGLKRGDGRALRS